MIVYSMRSNRYKFTLSIYLLLSTFSFCLWGKFSIEDELFAKGVSILYNKKVDTFLDYWIKSTKDRSIYQYTEREYRTKRIPFLDQNTLSDNSFLVIPLQWIVTPVQQIDEKVNKNKDFYNQDFYTSILQSGVLHFPNNVILGETWNSIVFGHSSYRNKDPWKYKNIFMSLPLVDIWDELRIYKKIWTWYTRLVYTVYSSYETTSDDVSILASSNVQKLTLFTCTPIGSSKKRRVVVAKIKKASSIKKTNTSVVKVAIPSKK